MEAICADKPIPTVFITGSPADVQARQPGSLVLHKPVHASRLAEAVRQVMLENKPEQA